MKQLNKKRYFYFVIVILCFLYSCTVVAEYDKIYLYDEDMQLSPYANELYEISAHTYREGSSASYGSKSGGGCGCY